MGGGQKNFFLAPLAKLSPPHFQNRGAAPASDYRCVLFCSLLFGVFTSLCVHGSLWRKNVHRNCYTLLHRRPSIVDRTPALIDPIARYLSRIVIFAYLACGALRIYPRRNIAITFGTGKTRMVWLPSGEKIWRYVYSFRQNTRAWRTDGRTDGHTDGHCATA